MIPLHHASPAAGNNGTVSASQHRKNLACTPGHACETRGRARQPLWGTRAIERSTEKRQGAAGEGACVTSQSLKITQYHLGKHSQGRNSGPSAIEPWRSPSSLDLATTGPEQRRLGSPPTKHFIIQHSQRARYQCHPYVARPSRSCVQLEFHCIHPQMFHFVLRCIAIAGLWYFRSMRLVQAVLLKMVVKRFWSFILTSYSPVAQFRILVKFFPHSNESLFAVVVGLLADVWSGKPQLDILVVFLVCIRSRWWSIFWCRSH